MIVHVLLLFLCAKPELTELNKRRSGIYKMPSLNLWNCSYILQIFKENKFLSNLKVFNINDDTIVQFFAWFLCPKPQQIGANKRCISMYENRVTHCFKHYLFSYKYLMNQKDMIAKNLL
jgi:hypothetical protein